MNLHLNNRLKNAVLTGGLALIVVALFASCRLGALSQNEDTTEVETLDQSCYPENGGGGLEITKSQPVIQTFTVGVSGLLSRVVLPRVHHHRCKPTENLVVELGYMNDTALQSPASVRIELPPDSVASLGDTSGKIEIKLQSYGIKVVKGEVLGIRLSSRCLGGACTYAWEGELEAYDGGTTIIFGTKNLRDMVFETYVLPQ